MPTKLIPPFISDVEELRLALHDWRQKYNTMWLIERHGFGVLRKQRYCTYLPTVSVVSVRNRRYQRRRSHAPLSRRSRRLRQSQLRDEPHD